GRRGLKWASTPAQQITAIHDPKQITFLTNQYDGNGRVTQQTQADATTFQFAYTLDGNGKVTQTDVTDSRGIVRRLGFNGAGQALTDTRAYGTAIAQTTTYERQATTNLVAAMTDALNRRTELTYDGQGNVLTVPRRRRVFAMIATRSNSAGASKID